MAGLQIMRKRVKIFNIAAICLLFLCLSSFFAQRVSAENAADGPSLQAGQAVIDTHTETSRILAAVETRISSTKLIETARSKLLTMDDKRTRLLSDLSDRVVGDETSIGSNIAFLLITVLIALS
jgi:hypothetical protein